MLIRFPVQQQRHPLVGLLTKNKRSLPACLLADAQTLAFGLSPQSPAFLLHRGVSKLSVYRIQLLLQVRRFRAFRIVDVVELSCQVAGGALERTNILAGVSPGQRTLGAIDV